MKLLRYMLVLVFLVTAFYSSSQEPQYIKVINFRVDDAIDVTTMQNLAQEYSYMGRSVYGPHYRRTASWALLIIESNENEKNLNFTTGKRSDYIEKFKQDSEEWWENGAWRQPSQAERDRVRARMKESKQSNEKWSSIVPGVFTRIKVLTKGEHPKGFKNYVPEIRNGKGEIIGYIEDGYFIPDKSIATRFEEGKVYRLTIEVPQDYGGRVEEKPEEAMPGFATFTTEPVGATVTITQYGNIMSSGVANPSYMAILPYGTYSYTVSAPNYHSEEGTLTIGAEEQTPMVKLRPAFGSLTINSTPSGASVMIDGMMQSGVTPLTIPQLPSGPHTITLNKTDYSQATRTVVIADGQATVENIALDARFAMITINSLPGASIYVDNKLVGTGSYSGNLNSGMHILKATLKSHKDATDQIQVAAKVPQTIELKPTPIYGRLTVGSSPRGADIVVGGVKRGVTPMNITDLLVGEYDVVISKAGYASHSQRVVIDEKTPVVINPTLQNGRSVTITTGVAGDVIYVDDRYIGTSPVTMELSFGAHTLMASRSDGENIASTTETVTVGQGSTPLTFTLSIMSSGLRPRWSSSATSEQRRILGNLIDNMVAVKGGTFTMGATSEQGSDAYDWEKPTYRVTLSDYHIGKYEVTQEEWQAVMGNNPSYFKGFKKPVESVSWNDCQEFIRRLNALTGLNFMLPTEAQWEYAARGGNMSKGYKYSGSNDIDRVAYYNKSSGGPLIVGSKQPNELGLYDMSGNVWEWCSDAWYSYDSSSATDPKHKGKKGSDRVFRGGSWYDGAWSCRVSNRSFISPGYSNYDLGLRLVCP